MDVWDRVIRDLEDALVEAEESADDPEMCRPSDVANWLEALARNIRGRAAEVRAGRFPAGRC